VLRLPWRHAAIGVALVLSAAGYAALPPRAAAAPTPATHHVTAAHRAKTVTLKIDLNGNFRGFSNPKITLHRGQTLKVVNHDRMTHTVTSNGVDANGTRLFDTSVTPGHRVTVANANRLVAGKYTFYCRIHPNMKGTLTVVGGGGTVRAAKQSFNQPLHLPPVETGANITVPIKQARVQVLPAGPKTLMWTYGGSYPGPTIRRTAGQDTKVTFVDKLPASAGKLTVHLHGDHHSSADDGQPTTHLIGTGASKTYDFPLTDGGLPERAAIDFYHDHRMDVTSRNVWEGLQGMFLVDPAPSEPTFNLPSGKYDVPLMVSDRSFDKNNQLTHPFTASGMPRDEGTVGDKVLVDGRYAPYLNVATHRYRLRLLNTSNFQAYNFALSDHQKFVQVGTGSGLLPKPVTRSTILLGPAQRADVIVDFSGELHKNVVLESVARTDHPPRGSAASPSVQIMQFRVRTKVVDGNAARPVLERAPIMPASTGAFTWTLGGSGMRWTINGKQYDPNVVDVDVPLGATQTWTIRNKTKLTHFVHLHEEQWETVLRDGKPPPPWERGLEDTWRLDPGESIEVKAHFTDYEGVFMIHCHMLDHEDDGMMAQFAVGALPNGVHLAAAGSSSSSGAMDMAMAVPHVATHGGSMAGMHMAASAASVPAPATPAFWPRTLRRAAVALAIELGALLALRLLLGYRRRFDSLY
jgi:spore coat protein A